MRNVNFLLHLSLIEIQMIPTQSNKYILMFPKNINTLNHCFQSREAPQNIRAFSRELHSELRCVVESSNITPYKLYYNGGTLWAHFTNMDWLSRQHE